MTANASVHCGICHFDCVGDREIFCDTCETWFHYSCENLTNKAFNLFSKSPLPYSCSLCNFYLDTREYKYEKALRRLSEATRKGKCDEAIKVESIYMRGESKYVTSSVCNSVSYSHLIQDSVSSSLLGDNWVSSVPVSVTGNGNCLFNAISVYLYGNEKFAAEIKVKTCIEMATNASFYIKQHSTSMIPVISPSFKEATTECALDGKHSSAWTLLAASTVIKRNIQSVYPVVNGPTDKYISILNTCFKPRVNKSQGDVTIMWTHTSNKSSHWTPNHFVPLITLQDEGSNPINIDSFVDFPPLSPSPSNKMSVDISFLSTACDNDKRSSPSSDMSDNEAFSVLEIPTAMYTSSPKSLVSEHLSSDLSDDTVVTSLKQDSDNDVVNVTNLSNKVDHPFQKPSQNGLNGKFMSVDKVFQSAQRQKPIGQYIPSGIKENVFFL